MPLTSGQKVLIGTSVIGAVFVGIILVSVFGWWMYTKYKSTPLPTPVRLPTPVGSMNPVLGPYVVENAIPTAGGSIVSTGHIDKDLYYDSDVYGYYGWRAVSVKSGKVDDTKTSAINWNTQLYTVFLVDDKQDSGFTFRLPKQTGVLNAAGIEFELVATFYDNALTTGEPLYKELPLKRVVATTSPLLVEESDVPAVNKLLKD